MTRILRLAVALGFAVLVGRATGLSAATVRALSLADLVARADRILVTEVVEVRCVARDLRGDTIPLTLVTLSVQRALKGAGASQLVLEFPGGRLGADRLEIDGLPRFAPGDRDVLFLHANTLPVSPLVGLMQGRIRIQSAGDPPGDYVAAWDGRLLTEADLVATGQGPAPHPDAGQASRLADAAHASGLASADVAQASRLSAADAAHAFGQASTDVGQASRLSAADAAHASGVASTGVGQASSGAEAAVAAKAARLSSAGAVTLAAFERAVRQAVHAAAARSGAGAPGAGEPGTLAQASHGAEDSAVEAWFLPPVPANASQAVAPLTVAVHLGSAPELLDGCPDWGCALASRDAFRRVARIGTVSSAPSGAAETAGGDPSGPAETISLEWGRSVFGYAMDEDTAALSVRRTMRTATSTRVVFNDRLAWNSPGENARSSTSKAGTPTPPASRQLLDLPAVAVRELSLLTTGQAAQTAAGPGSSSAAAEGRAAPRRVPPARTEAVAEPRDAAASACNPAQAFVDPTSLVFESPDSLLMTGYQVGFFRPDAASPTQIVDLPLNALMIHRVVDLPPAAVRGLQSSLVANIRTSGLATPLGIVYTYRVRGVWSGGLTAWSGSSQPFVRCY